MEIINKNIDDGTPFDCGRTSSDYAKYRDIYPELFYDKIINRQLCITGQDVLDLGTGQASYQEICIDTELNGQLSIFLMNSYSLIKQKVEQ